MTSDSHVATKTAPLLQKKTEKNIKGLKPLTNSEDSKEHNLKYLDVPSHIISYAWSHPSESMKQIHDKKLAYKEQIQRGQKLYKAKMYAKSHKPENPYDIPLTQRETAEEFCKKVADYVRTNSRLNNKEKAAEISKPYRIRRKISSGSYSMESVNEQKLPKILRYAWKGKIVKLKKYLEQTSKWAKINVQDDQGRTALHFAASWGCSKTVKILLTIPTIDLNITDEEGKAPVYKAVEIESLPCVKLLVDHGCLVGLPALDGRTAFEFALQEMGDQNLEILKYLYYEGEMNKERKCKGRLSHLHICCLAKRRVDTKEIAKELIANGELMNATEGLGRTPLMLATLMGRMDLVMLLTALSADVCHVDMSLKAAIQYASSENERLTGILRRAIEIQRSPVRQSNGNV